MSIAQKGIRKKLKTIFTVIVIASFIMSIGFSQISGANDAGFILRDCIDCVKIDYTCSRCEFIKSADYQLRLFSASATLPLYAILIIIFAAYTTVDFHRLYTLVGMKIRMNN